MADAKHTPMVVAAAREMCRLASQMCGVDNDDNWKTYGEGYLAEAASVLEAAGLPALLSELKNVSFLLMSACLVIKDDDARGVALAAVKRARGAIAAATGNTA